MKTVKDPTYDLMKGIYMQHVPLQTELVNPFQANKRQRKKPIIKTNRILYNISLFIPLI